MTNERETIGRRAGPALLLVFLAPMFAEILPGATRFSSLFVLPIEIAVWGGGAVLIREVVRRRGLGWWSLLLMGLALAVAEEFLIQQTSVAPLVIRLKGETWARAFDVNYVYLVWALVYESVWVVLLPVLTVELVFPGRQRDPWLSRGAAIVTSILFVVGCIFAWFTWTQIARTKVFHQPAFNPPIALVIVALAAIVALILVAMRYPGRSRSSTMSPPAPWLTGLLAAVWATLWFGLVVLAFGIAPQVSAGLVTALAIVVIAMLTFTIPRWTAHGNWSRRHDFALLAGCLLGSMAVSFVAFQGADPKDLWFKIAVDAAASIGLVWLGRRVLMQN